VRYTGWTVPNQQQYSYAPNQNAVPMNSYPPYGQQAGTPYNYSQTANAYEGNPGDQQPAYYDATQTEAPGGTGPRQCEGLIE